MPFILWLLPVLAIVSGILAATPGQVLTGIALVMLTWSRAAALLSKSFTAEPGEGSALSHFLPRPTSS